jgi:hypothetical protein
MMKNPHSDGSATSLRPCLGRDAQPAYFPTGPHADGRDRLAALEQIAQQRLNDVQHQGDDDMDSDSLRNSKLGVFPDKSLRQLGGAEGSKAGRNFGHSPCSPPIQGAEKSPALPGMNGKARP